LDVVLPLPGLVEGAAGLGHIQRTVDRDGTLRRLPLLYRVPGGLLPALSLAAVFRHLNVNPATIKIEPRQDSHPDAGWVLRFTPRPGDDVLIPMDAEGRAWVNFAGPWGKRFVHFPYSWLVEQMAAPDGASRLPAWFEGKTAVVANLTTGAGDRGPTPFEQDFVFGELHLHVLNMVLTRQFLRDATTRESVLITAVPLVLLTVVALIGGPSLILSCFAVIFGGLLFMLQRGFHAGVVLPAVHPMLSLTMGLVFLLTARFVIVDGERRRFLSILGACLPPQTIRQIKQHPNRIAALLAGRRRELTVLFADIRGFSTYCTRVDPAEVQDILHDYLTAMTIVIRSHGGTLDKYMGDGVMAFFGDADPEGGGSHAQEERVARQAANAVRAGIAMQREMSVLNGRWAAKGRDPHHIRIGINTGPMTVGNLGTEYLWDYTVVGSEVNKAQRLEGAAEPGGILLAERTYTLARKKQVIPHDLAAQSFVLKGLGTDSSLYVLAPDLVTRLATPTP
jgi:adenylate cyclase